MEFIWMNKSEKDWFNDAMYNGWIMPSVVWWKRLPVIRNFRYAYHMRKAQEMNRELSSTGLFFGGMAQYDLWVLYGMLKGYENLK